MGETHLIQGGGLVLKRSLLFILIALCVSSTVAVAALQSAGMQVSFDSALVDAADRGDRYAVESLIKSGKYVDEKGKFGVTALMRAVYRGHHEIVDMLLNAGADPNLTDIGGATALHISAREGYEGITGKLLKYEAAPNAIDIEGWTPLMRAAANGHDAVVAMLVDDGANVNLTNEMGENALMLAVSNENVDTVRKLILSGASPKAQDVEGISAMDIASRKQNEELRELVFETASATITIEKETAEEISGLMPQGGKRKTGEESQAAENSEPATEELEVASVAAPTDSSFEEIFEASLAHGKGLPWDGKSRKDKDAEGKALPWLSDAPENKSGDAKPEPVKIAKAETQTIKTDAAPEEKPAQAPAEPLISSSAATEKESRSMQLAAADEYFAGEEEGSAEYYLQLNAFLTTDMVEKDWKKLQAGNKDLLGDLELRISKVVMPPRGRIVYREQAGALRSKKEAEKRCESLRSRGVECFVVESAMIEFGEVEQPDLAELKVEALPEMPETPAGPQPRAKPNRPAPKTVAKEDADREAYPELPAEAPEPAAEPVTAGVTPPWVAETPEKAEDKTEPEAQQAEESDSGEALPALLAKVESDVLPWLAEADAQAKDEKEQAPGSEETKAEAMPEDTEPAKKGTELQALIESLEEMETSTTTETAEASKARVTETAESDERPEQETEQKQDVSPEPAFLAAERKQRKAQALETIKPQMKAEEVELPQPLTQKEMEELPEVEPYKDMEAAPVKPKVEVAEAIRVPLSEEAEPVEQPIEVAPAPQVYTKPSITAPAYPSRPIRGKRIWVEMASFASEKEAREFWQNVKQLYADHLDPLRIRIIRPLSRSARQQIKLRVGPARSKEDVDSLCSIATEHDLDCTTIADLGSSGRMAGGRTRISRKEYGERYSFRNNRPGNPRGSIDPNTGRELPVYWSQLGSYDSNREAMEHWSQIRQTNYDLLSHLEPNVSLPRYSSAAHAYYRLRVGPFRSRLKASDLCTALRNRYHQCVAVKGN